MSTAPYWFESKAIHLPSGDHSGLPLNPALMSVRLIGFVPSALQTQISELPELSEMKAILRPSGEIRCSCSFDDQENKGFDGVLTSLPPVSSSLQMSELPVPLT
jgi:muconolactone delta-isomerase